MEHIFYQAQFGENWFTYPNLYSRFVKELSNGSKIVEVGCWKGKSIAYLAVEIINSGKDIKVDAIDTWKGTPDEDVHQKDKYVIEDKLYELFLSNIAPVSSVINPIRMSSVEAAKLYEDESIDVVFIDAGHTYEDVKADILAWYPKVKKGGYVSGHDYPWSGGDAVKKAVDELVRGFEVTEGCWVHKKP
jgi:cephalosporin hydroxylase